MNSSEFKLNLAVVIGINDYQNGIPILGTARQDAEAIATILQTNYQYQVHLITDNQATAHNLRQWLETELPNVTKKVTPSRLLFYFAGHGIALNGDDGPQGYLIPQDAKLGDVSTYIPMQQIETALTQLSCRHCLVILDCCFAGAFRWSSTRKLIPITETIHKERYDRFIQDPAWQVITSAASDQSALDNLDLKGDRGIAKNNTQHSPFANALIEALSGTADAYPPARNGKPAGDGVITATELYLYLRDSVEIPTDANFQRQTPQIWCLKKHDKGEFIFLPPGHELNLPPAPSIDELEDNNPYRGLKSYEIKDSSLFFGRTALIEKLCDAMSDRPFTVVLGASGSGKSSLVKAGLMSHLNGSAQTEQSQNQRLKPQKQPHLCKHPAWKILAPIRPGEFPLSSLHIALRELGSSETSQDDSKAIEVWSQANPGKKLLLVVDQLEELVTLCHNDRERQQFLNLLADLLEAHPDRFRLVMTLRSDFEPQFRSTPLEPLWQAARFVVPAMTREELREAIEEPASVKVVYFESLDNRGDIVDQLIDEVAGMPGALPLLSFALSELYLKLARRYLAAQITDETVERVITWADYDELGGVTKSLTRRADEEYEALVQTDPAYEQTIRHVMLRMVAVGGEMARRQVPESELRYPEPENTRIREAIDRFSSARLLVSGTDADNNPYIEPAHDVLVRGWEKLLSWKKKEEENLILQRRLTPAAAEWDSFKNKEHSKGILDKVDPVMNLLDRGLFTVENLATRIPAQLVRFLRRSQNQQELSKQKPSQFLWDGNPYLSLLAQKFQSKDNWLNQLEGEFVQQSVLQKRRKSSWQWRIAIGVMLGLSGLTIFAFIQQNIAEQQKKATIVKSLSSKALAERDIFPQSSLLLAIESVKMDVSNRYSNIYLLKKLLSDIGGIALAGHSKPVVAVTFILNGDWLATGSKDGTVRLWDQTNHDRPPKILQGKIGEIKSIAISPDGTWLAAIGTDTKIQLWNLTSSEAISELSPLSGHTAAINTLSFSPDGNWLATGSEDKTVRLWNMKTAVPGAQSIVLKRHSASVTQVVFSPSGRWLATGEYNFEDFHPRLWDMKTISNTSTPTILKAKPVVENIILKLAFSHDEKHLAAAISYSAQVWDLTTINPSPQPTVLKGPGSWFYALAFSPDGHWLAAGGGTGNIKLWNITLADYADRPIVLQGHQAAVTALTFSPDSHWVLTGSSDYTTRKWDLSQPTIPSTVLLGHEGAINSITLSPYGQWLATASEDRQARLWNLSNLLNDTINYSVSNISILSVAISSDGKWLAASGSDNKIRLWKITEPLHSTILLPEHSEAIRYLAFSPNGQWLASGSDDGTARLWNLTTANPATDSIILQGHTSGIAGMAFTPDSRKLITGSWGGDTTIRLWDITTTNPSANPIVLPGHTNGVRDLVVSKDGQKLVTGGQDGLAKVWDLTNLSSPPIILSGHTSNLKSVAISPDGRWVGTSSWEPDFSARLWDLVAQNPSANPIILQFSGRLFKVDFSADGHWFAAASWDNTAQLQDMTHLAQKPIQLKGHRQRILGMSFSPDSQWLATGSEDQSIRLWNPNDLTAAPIILSPRSQISDWALTFSSDSRWLVSGHSDGKARLWPLKLEELSHIACQTAGRNLTQEEWQQFLPGNPPAC
jgi:WD40 repeat protein/energy-coupling factor transporter ATP-binding protein EcfA2